MVTIKSFKISLHVILIRLEGGPRSPVGATFPIFVSSRISIRTNRFSRGTGGAGNGHTFGTSGRWYPLCTSNPYLQGFCLSNVHLPCIRPSSNVRGTRNAPSHNRTRPSLQRDVFFLFAAPRRRTVAGQREYTYPPSLNSYYYRLGRWWSSLGASLSCVMARRRVAC